MGQTSNERQLTIVDFQKGAGTVWEILDVDGEIDAYSGGGVSVDSKIGRSVDGGEEYKGNSITSNRERVTFTATFRQTVERYLRAKELANCPINIRARFKCGDIRDINNFQAITQLTDSVTTSRGLNDNLANASEQTGNDLMSTLAMSAGLLEEFTQLAHNDISQTVTDVAINKVIFIGPRQCYGDCGDQFDGTEEIAFVTDLDAAPGYAGTSAPYVGLSVDKGLTWDLTIIDDFLTANATGIVKHGSNLVVFSPNHPPSVVAIQDLKDDLGPTSFISSSGITANFPNDGMVFPNGDIIAFADGGFIFISTDGGGSWTSFDAATITTSNLTVGTISGDNLGWIGGASGAVVMIKGPSGARIGSLAVVTQADGTALADAVNSIAAPPNRNELYIGTDAGTIWRSTDPQNINAPRYVLPSFPSDGVGTIDDLQFTGFRGQILFIIQTNASSLSRILIDRSGGALGNAQVSPIGTELSPANQGLNSIAVADGQHAITVGEVDGSQGFIGVVRQ